MKRQRMKHRILEAAKKGAATIEVLATRTGYSREQVKSVVDRAIVEGSAAISFKQILIIEE